MQRTNFFFFNHDDDDHHDYRKNPKDSRIKSDLTKKLTQLFFNDLRRRTNTLAEALELEARMSANASAITKNKIS